MSFTLLNVKKTKEYKSMIREFANSFKAILYDRIVSPLSSAFICSWSIINWKLLLVLFGDGDSVVNKINYIEQNLLNKSTILYYPILSTVFIIVIYPWLSNIAYFIWQLANSFKLKTRLKFEDSSPLTLKQSIELRKEIQRKDLEFNELLQGKNETISNLDNHNKYLTDIISQKEKELDALKNSTTNQTVNHIKQEANADYKEWLNEFHERFDNNPHYKNEFDDVLDASLGTLGRPLDGDTLRYFTSAGIIDYNPQNRGVKLSEKGRYFASLLTKALRK